MKNGGRPVFPNISEMVGDEPKAMTLRDWFAGQALNGLLAMHGPHGHIKIGGKELGTLTDFARIAYSCADEMLKAREAE